MRFLIFGDVHGNLPALEKMLNEERGNYDILISHGDIVNYGPWSNECVDLLSTENCICLKGNHEEYFIDGVYNGINIIPKTFFEYCYPLFHRKDKIKSYKTSLSIPDYTIVHTIDDKYIFHDTDMKSISMNENFIIGHSHYQFFRNVDGFQLYNTGSVGQNRKFLNIINYIILDSHSKYVGLKSLKYNVDIVIDAMINLKYPKVCLDYYQKKRRA